jgi:hypothetical protein
MDTTDPQNPWTPQDEGDHAPIKKEWWTNELFFTTHDDHHLYNLMTSYAVTHEPPSCFYQYVLFNMTTGKLIQERVLNDTLTELTTQKNKVDLHYKHNTLTGLYPRYHIHHHEPDRGFATDIDMDAKALPHWTTQDTTNGNLPIGLNHFRYGFLPHLAVTGTMTLNGTTQQIDGKGYLEHAYGNWSYENPLQTLSGMGTTLTTYLRLTYWWLSHHRRRLPTRIGFSSENNMLGYDWLWGVLDNNWSFFFGNALLWVNDGPSFGALYVTPDGKHYWEFADVHFKYTTLIYNKTYDYYYPKNLELTGRLDHKTITLRFTSTTEGYDYIDLPRNTKYFHAYILSELPGTVDGTYTENGTTIPLHGLCKNVPLRQAPTKGHTAVHFTLLKPPQGLGLTIDLESHPKKTKTTTILQLAPRPRFSRKKNRLDPATIPRETILP